MNLDEKMMVKFLNKNGVDTRFISIYENNIYINNLKFSKFSRNKEDLFHEEYPEVNVIRSKLFQKICVKVSRNIKNQIKPRDIIYIPNMDCLENVFLYILLEPYKRKYGISIVDEYASDVINVSTYCLNDFVLHYLDLILSGNKITNTYEKNTIYPLKNIHHEWLDELNIKFNINKKSINVYNNEISNNLLSFLEQQIPNAKESIIQTVDYLDKNNIE